MTDPLSSQCDICNDLIDMELGDTMVIETFDNVELPDGKNDLVMYLLSVLATFGTSEEDEAMANAIAEKREVVAHQRCLDETAFSNGVELLTEDTE